MFGQHWVERWAPFCQGEDEIGNKMLLTLLPQCFTEGFGGVFAFQMHRDRGRYFRDLD